MTKVDYVSNEVKQIKEQLEIAVDEAALFNSREVLFGKTPTDDSELKKISASFNPFFQSWSTAANSVREKIGLPKDQPSVRESAAVMSVALGGIRPISEVNWSLRWGRVVRFGGSATPRAPPSSERRRRHVGKSVYQKISRA